MVVRRCRFSININVQAPTLWIPQSHKDPSAPLLLLVLGSLSVVSDLSASKNAQDDNEKQSMTLSKQQRISLLYNKYNMQLQAISAILTTLTKHREKQANPSVWIPTSLSLSLSLW
jgi:hypothetical protein